VLERRKKQKEKRKKGKKEQTKSIRMRAAITSTIFPPRYRIAKARTISAVAIYRPNEKNSHVTHAINRKGRYEAMLAQMPDAEEGESRAKCKAVSIVEVQVRKENPRPVI
jgi:hypothetical protein